MDMQKRRKRRAARDRADHCGGSVRRDRLSTFGNWLPPRIWRRIARYRSGDQHAGGRRLREPVARRAEHRLHLEPYRKFRRLFRQAIRNRLVGFGVRRSGCPRPSTRRPTILVRRSRRRTASSSRAIATIRPTTSMSLTGERRLVGRASSGRISTTRAWLDESAALFKAPAMEVMLYSRAAARTAASRQDLPERRRRSRPSLVGGGPRRRSDDRPSITPDGTDDLLRLAIGRNARRARSLLCARVRAPRSRSGRRFI